MTRLKPEQLKFVAVLLLVSASTFAQQPGVPPQTSTNSSVATVSVASQLTLVDVTVTDSGGKAVHGLTASNFIVKEDGNPQPLRSFQEYGSEKASMQAPLPLPPNVYTNAQSPAPTTSAINVILFDDVTTGRSLAMSLANVGYPKSETENYLKSMPPGTQVAVLELTNGLRLVQGITTDRNVLRGAVDSIAYKPVRAAYVIPPVSQEERCTAANNQSRMVLDALEQVAAYLTGIQGRKNLIWFTPGIPWLTDYSRYSGSACLADYTKELQRVYGLLTAARVSLYPVSPHGLAGGGTDASVAGPTPLGGRGRMGNAMAARLGGVAAVNAIVDENWSLSDMAKATGGIAYYNRNDLDGAVAAAVATGSDYYALSYVPPTAKFDGKYHTIKVVVNRPGLHLQYRDGYTALDLTKRVKPIETASVQATPQPLAELLAAMGHGVAFSTQLLFDVRVAPSTTPAKPGDPPVMGLLNPTLKGKHLVRYDVMTGLSARQFTLTDGPDGKREGSVGFIVAAYDGAGRMLNSQNGTSAFSMKADEVKQFLQRPFQIPLQFDLPAGKIFVRIGVLDIPSGKIGTVEIPVKVAK